MQIVMTAAGRGSRFADYSPVPKPFIEFDGKQMWQHAVEPWLKYGPVTLAFHSDHKKYVGNVTHNVVWIDTFTSGAAETAYLASKHLPKLDKICFIDSDGLLEFDHWDTSFGGTFVVNGNSPQHSFVRLDANGFIHEIVEKQVISNTVNTGHYWWESLEQFQQIFEYAQKNNLRSKNEFYMAPMYALGIQMGFKFKSQMAKKLTCWGTPKELEDYLHAHNIT